MKHQLIRIIVVVGVLFILIVGRTSSSPAASEPAWVDKIDPQVLAAAESGETEFLVIMREQADLGRAAALGSKLEKGTYVFETLSEMAATSQKSLRDSLDSLGVEYHPFWVVNMLWVRGDYPILQKIAQRVEVTHIAANPQVQLDLLDNQPQGVRPQTTNAIEWNVSQINAPAVWNLGYTGEGIVIGGADTGYAWDHPALKDKYRGWDGATADHNYNWHDSIHEDNPNSTIGNPCGFDIPAPCDDYGHGTHTMGTMAGEDGANQIGVAPGAQWIGCRNMEEGWGTPATYTECYEWFIAPTDLNNENPDPAKAPHVINNSWACPASEGCIEPSILITVVQSVRAAGIVTVHSAGNAGSGCGTVNTPAAIYDESFSVGATDSSDAIASFSSRGPVTVDGSNRLKPDISAPGDNIRSSTNGGGYGYNSGTSMAAPHVAGVVALLLSANPNLIGQVSEVETLIQESAQPLYTNDGCGGDSVNTHPNHTYGWGLVDAWAAIQKTLTILYLIAVLVENILQVQLSSL